MNRPPSILRGFSMEFLGNANSIWKLACRCAISDGVPRRSLYVALIVGTVLNRSIEKLMLPDAAARIASNFYGVTLVAPASYALGVGELILSLALLFGFYRTISYGLSLLIHTVTVVVSWRQLFDPWGVAKVGNHLWISTWPTWGGFAALFLMRQWDTF